MSTWRVCWNVVGSVLASAGDDCYVRLWKSNYMNEWKCFAEIVGDTCQVRIDSILLDQQQQQLLQKQNLAQTSKPQSTSQFSNSQQQKQTRKSSTIQQQSSNSNSSGAPTNQPNPTSATPLFNKSISNSHKNNNVPPATVLPQKSTSNTNDVPWH